MVTAVAVMAIVLIAAASATALIIRQMAAARRQQYRDEFGAFTVADRVEKRRERAAMRRAEKVARVQTLRRRRIARAGTSGHGLAFHGH